MLYWQGVWQNSGDPKFESVKFFDTQDIEIDPDVYGYLLNCFLARAMAKRLRGCLFPPGRQVWANLLR